LAVGLAGAWEASAATVMTHSAKSGEYKGGRLILRGVGGRVSYAISSGRAGTVSVRRLHRRLFLPGLPATATLHVAGMRGGDEPTFRLTKPRYSASRRTVSYRAKPLDGKPLPSRAARASGYRASRRFGAASLSIVGHPRLTGGDNGGNDCQTNIGNMTDGDLANNGPKAWGNPIQLVSSQQWDTDDWSPPPPGDRFDPLKNTGSFVSEGGFLRGCWQSTVWQFVPRCFNDGCGPDGTFTLTAGWPWGSFPPTYTCTSSNPQFTCLDLGGGNWRLIPAA
jgi:hypothetical protein